MPKHECFVFTKKDGDCLKNNKGNTLKLYKRAISLVLKSTFPILQKMVEEHPHQQF